MGGIITKEYLEVIIKMKKAGNDPDMKTKLLVAEYVRMLEKLKDKWFKEYLDAEENYLEAVKEERFLNDLGKA